MPPANVTVRYLEMTGAGDLRPKRSPESGVRFVSVPHPMPEINRFFYLAIGRPWMWIERDEWTPADWKAWVERPELATSILSVNGIPAGYSEFLRHGNGDVEIKLLGLLDGFIGRGLGGHLVTEAAARAWEMGAVRVILDTCSLDHPHALANYRARGFREIRSETQLRDLPAMPSALRA